MWVKHNIVSQQHNAMAMVKPQAVMPPSHSNHFDLPPPRPKGIKHHPLVKPMKHHSLVDFMVEDDTLANSSTESVTGSLPTDSSGECSTPVPSHDPLQGHHVHHPSHPSPASPPRLQIQLPTPQSTPQKGFFKGIAHHCHTLQLLPTASSPRTFAGTFSPRQSDGSMSMQNHNSTTGPLPPPQRLGTIIQQHHRQQYPHHHSFRAMDSEDSTVVLVPGEKERISAASGTHNQNQNQFVVMPEDKYVPDMVEEENSSSSGNDRRSLWLRTVLAVIISVIGATCGMYPSVVTFARGIGLSFVGFILPPILYLCAREGAGRGVEYTSSIMMALSSLIGFGLFNMVLVCVSVFTEHKFMPSQGY
jgi:hypothetical protein